MELMGRQEIATLLGVSHQRVTQLTHRPDFPKPLAVLALGQVWSGADVRAWAERRHD